MTTQLPLPEPPVRRKRPLPNLLAQGFQLVLRNWPCLVWAYAVNLFFALLAAVPFATGLGSYLDHSLAAQKIAGTIDLGSITELGLQIRDTSFFPMVMHTSGWLGLFQVLALFFLFAGSMFVFVAAEPPLFSVLLRGGVAYFWRFVRAAILAGGSAAVIVSVLFAIRAGLLARTNAVYVGRRMFVFATISLFVILLVALLLRLWWDLVEVYIVRNAMDGERRVHLALLPALRLLFRHFFRAFGSFLLAGLAGVTALGLCLAVWKSLPAHQVLMAALLIQLGLFLLLASRFWQRGLEAAFVMAVDPPMVIAEELLLEASVSTDVISTVEDFTPAPRAGGLSEPTLQDLVAKLQTEPWANPEALPPLPSRPLPEFFPGPAKPSEVSDPSVSLLDRHEAKFPLGGVTAGTEPDSAASVEGKKVVPEESPDKTPQSEKKPLS